MIKLDTIKQSDLNLFAKWRNHASVRRGLRSWQLTQEINQIEWLKKISSDETCQYFAIRQAGKIDPVGYCGLDKIHLVDRRAEISLLISPNAQGKNFGSEAVKELFKYAFQVLGLNSIYGEVYRTSKAVEFWQKCGFIVYGTIPYAKYYDGLFHNSDIIVMTDKRYKDVHKYEQD